MTAARAHTDADTTETATMGYTLGNGNGNGTGRNGGDGNGGLPGVLLHKTPLREQIRSILRGWLVYGRMAPGDGLNERELGDQLGSSRTPVREALLLLAVEGLVAVHPHEGYFVAPVTREEGEDLFGLLGHVERRALVRAGLPSEVELDRLEEIDRERRDAGDPVYRMELDREWHDLLLPVERIGEVYRGEIDRLKNRAARYELASLEDEADQEGALEEHAAIVKALRNGQLEKAASLLEEHWLQGAAYARRLPVQEPFRTA